MSKPLRILVVDDDEDNANSLGELFELEGHHVTVAHSGEDAVAAYVTSNFDLAFMDVMMPGLNGVESFMEIRKLKPEAKVFMMTGYSVEQLLQQAMDHGAMGVLTKPVDIDKLLRAVDEVRPGGIVLIADEDPMFGASLKQLVEGAGLRCDHLRRESDLLMDADALAIIDIGKPLINCVEVYTRLRRQGHARPSIIVTKSADQSGDAMAALRDVAVTGILNKPFDPMLLLQRLTILAA
ncbi:response regulator [Aestuariivirga sp.]|uniref:response regulator n=1 Tax=Aestuariivirga sp. TaxID=2650926 RepID=UPI00359402EF